MNGRERFGSIGLCNRLGMREGESESRLLMGNTSVRACSTKGIMIDTGRRFILEAFVCLF